MADGKLTANPPNSIMPILEGPYPCHAEIDLAGCFPNEQIQGLILENDYPLA